MSAMSTEFDATIVAVIVLTTMVVIGRNRDKLDGWFRHYANVKAWLKAAPWILGGLASIGLGLALMYAALSLGIAAWPVAAAGLVPLIFGIALIHESFPTLAKRQINKAGGDARMANEDDYIRAGLIKPRKFVF